MRAGLYVRVLAYRPVQVSTPDLSTLVLFSSFAGMVEGWLRDPVRVGGRIHLDARYRHREAWLGDIISGRLLKVEGQFALTRERLFMVLRVPPASDDSITPGQGDVQYL